MEKKISREFLTSLISGYAWPHGDDIPVPSIIVGYALDALRELRLLNEEKIEWTPFDKPSPEMVKVEIQRIAEEGGEPT